MKTDSNPMGTLTPPQNRPHKETVDHQSAFAAISARTPVDEAFRTAFLRNKLLIAHTHPGLDIRAREQAVAALVDRLGREAARDMITQPRPGGVGEGFFYTPDFKTSCESADRGLFWEGLVGVGRESERGPAYARYLRAVANNPDVVGAHWFQYLDEPLTGRTLDGENAHIGFVTVADVAYEGLVEAARTANLAILRDLQRVRSQ